MYNKDQWISSFEDQLVILRPHLTARVLATMSLSAWHRHGRKDEDPVKAAREWSKGLDQQSPAAAAGTSAAATSAAPKKAARKRA